MELGLLNTLLYGLDRGLTAWTRGRLRIRRYLLLIQPLPGQLTRSPTPRKMLVRYLASRETAPGFPVTPREVERRLSAGARCFLLEIDGQFAGYAWFQRGPYEEDEVRCTFVPEPASTTLWDFDVYVEPKYRATRAFATLWSAASEALRSEGYRQTASRISAFNAGSVRAHARLGGEIVGSLIFISGSTWQLMLSRHRPYVHITNVNSPPPVVPVRHERREFDGSHAQ